LETFATVITDDNFSRYNLGMVAMRRCTGASRNYELKRKKRMHAPCFF